MKPKEKAAEKWAHDHDDCKCILANTDECPEIHKDAPSCLSCAFLAGVAWGDKHPKKKKVNDKDLLLTFGGEKGQGMSYAALRLKEVFGKKKGGKRK